MSEDEIKADEAEGQDINIRGILQFGPPFLQPEIGKRHDNGRGVGNGHPIVRHQGDRHRRDPFDCHAVQGDCIGQVDDLSAHLQQVCQFNRREIGRYRGLGELEGLEEKEAHPHIAQVDGGIDRVHQNANGRQTVFVDRASVSAKGARFDLGFILHRLKAQGRRFSIHCPSRREDALLGQGLLRSNTNQTCGQSGLPICGSEFLNSQHVLSPNSILNWYVSLDTNTHKPTGSKHPRYVTVGLV